MNFPMIIKVNGQPTEVEWYLSVDQMDEIERESQIAFDNFVRFLFAESCEEQEEYPEAFNRDRVYL